MILAVAIYGSVVPALTPLFPSAEVARALRNVSASGRSRRGGFSTNPASSHDRHLDGADGGSGAADFLGQGSCRFALVGSPPRNAVCQRAEPSDCAITSPPASTAIIFRRAGDFDRDLPLEDTE